MIIFLLLMLLVGGGMAEPVTVADVHVSACICPVWLENNSTACEMWCDGLRENAST